MTYRRVLAATFVLSLGLTGAAARAGFTPAWSYVPAPLRAQLATKSGGPLFLPARTPGFYRYRSGARVSNGTLTVTFTNRVRVRAGVWQWTKKTFVWNAKRYAGDCTAFATPDKTLQMSGNKVYWSGSSGVAWRCVKDARGRSFVLSASSTTGLGDGGLAFAVASGLDVSRRASATTVALNVLPRSVHRGATVIVSGVAGGCTAGDSVTLISRAFAATHTFAGVPAVHAQVGSAGRFSARAPIPAKRRPGAYVVTARCGGGNLGVSAHLTVAP
ncbi:MAG TPA: hypothetical protein VFJ93_13630 [Gaiellaceae bacterium]|nr:hypothetical protein [Gaiellaceae bacterium]